jgi:DNA helicase IV
VKHPEVPVEQRYLDHAYTQGLRMRDRAADLAKRDDLSASEVDAVILRAHFADRAKSLTRALAAALCFGRIDDPHDRYYIGRTHIEDEARQPVVIDWRARAAIAFYRATVADSMELTIRRRFILEDRTLVDILEEDFDDPESTIAGACGVPDPLLAELGRSRTGRMRDIVATIQAEQDEVIRAGVHECLIVQGGSGGTSLEVDVAVLSPVAAKGLEFDAVIVVEPSAIVDEEPGAERALFVALTRAVQHLSILHVSDLPVALQ